MALYMVEGFNKHRITFKKKWVIFYVDSVKHRLIASKLVSMKPNKEEWKVGDYTVTEVLSHEKM